MPGAQTRDQRWRLKAENSKIQMAWLLIDLTDNGRITLAVTTLQSENDLRAGKSSSPGESHPQALPEPDVNLSIHPALIAQPSVASPFANGQIDWVPSLQCALTNRPPSVRGA